MLVSATSISPPCQTQAKYSILLTHPNSAEPNKKSVHWSVQEKLKEKRERVTQQDAHEHPPWKGP